MSDNTGIAGIELAAKVATALADLDDDQLVSIGHTEAIDRIRAALAAYDEQRHRAA